MLCVVVLFIMCFVVCVCLCYYVFRMWSLCCGGCCYSLPCDCVDGCVISCVDVLCCLVLCWYDDVVCRDAFC